MPINKKFLAEFEHEEVYHVYNRTNNKELLFLSDHNRSYFLKKFNELLSPFVYTYCWCLLPNHFHFLIKVKPQIDITQHLSKLRARVKSENGYMESPLQLGVLIESSFKRFFQSYAQAFNVNTGRSGNLFYKPFKRILIETDDHFMQNVIYIHRNPVKHGVAQDFMKYKWSSWQSLLGNGKTNLQRDYLVELFGGREEFIRFHVGESRGEENRDANFW